MSFYLAVSEEHFPFVSPRSRNKHSFKMDEDGFDEEIAMDQPDWNDFTAAAAGYFGGIRIPATLITGSSLGFLFAFAGAMRDKNTTTSSAEKSRSYLFYCASIIL